MHESQGIGHAYGHDDKPTAVTPEPGTLLLLIGGMAVVLIADRIRKK